MKTSVGILTSLSLVTVLAGCCSVHQPVSQDTNKHVVIVDKDGSPNIYTNGHFSINFSYSDYLNDIFKSIEAYSRSTNGSHVITMFFQGGMDQRECGVERASSLSSTIMHDGSYPIFIDWDSDLFDTYLEHLTSVRQGRIAKQAGPLTAPMYLVSDIGRSIAREPVVWYEVFRTDIKEFGHLKSPYGRPYHDNRWMNTVAFEVQNANALYCYVQNHPRSATNAEVDAFLGDFNKSKGTQALRLVTYIVMSPIKYLLSSPLIDAMGKSAWDDMLRRTEMMFRTHSEFDLGWGDTRRREDPDAINQALHGEPEGALSIFIRRLKTFCDEHPDFSINMVGHSMGSIVINDMIQQQPHLPYSNIVYLSAACSIRSFERSVVPYLQENPNAHFYNLCLHPSAESREAEFLEVPPRGSLLEWIDEFISAPNSLEDRVIGKWENAIQAIRVIPPNTLNQVAIKALPSGNCRDQGPQSHGEMSEITFWDPTLWTTNMQQWDNRFWQSECACNKTK